MLLNYDTVDTGGISKVMKASAFVSMEILFTIKFKKCMAIC